MGVVLLGVLCLKVDDGIPILSSAVYILCVVLEDLLDGITFDGCIKSIQVVASSKVTIIGITLSTCPSPHPLSLFISLALALVLAPLSL